MADPKQVAAHVTKTTTITTTEASSAITTSTESSSESMKVDTVDDLLLMSHDTLSAEQIRKVICKKMEKSKEGEESRSMEKSNKVPKEVCALVDYMLDMLPSGYYKGRNKLMCGQGTRNEKKLNAYQKMFPPGTACFTVPPSDKMKKPNQHYKVLEGRKYICVEVGRNIP